MRAFTPYCINHAINPGSSHLSGYFYFMEQKYHPYWMWEDYKNGMWRKESKDYDDFNLPYVIEFTGNHILYGKAMIRVINEWPISCEHNLTDKSQNRKAWIGHAACCIEKNYPEYLVRLAWNQLNENQQRLANKAADFAIEQYFINLKSKKYAQNKFEF